jgi:hypothetical protein
MNLYEIDELIAAIPDDEPEMVEMYQEKRKQLIEEINKECAQFMGEHFKIQHIGVK